MGGGNFQQFRSQSVHFMSEGNAHWKFRLPVKQINCLRTGFDGSNLKPLAPHLFRDADSLPIMFPWNRFLRSQRRFCDGFLRRVRSDSAQAQLLKSYSVRNSEKRAHVVHAAHIVKQNRNRKAESFISRRKRGIRT